MRVVGVCSAACQQRDAWIPLRLPPAAQPPQVEAHHPGGVKEIVFPDGAVRKALPDGRELAVSAAHLSAEIREPRPTAALV